MNVSKKLNYLIEGYTFEDISSENFSPIYNHDENQDVTQIFIETFISDIKYITEVGLNEAKKVLIEYIRKVFKWIKEKVMQFIRFIRNKFSNLRKNTKTTVKNAIEIAKKAKDKNKKSPDLKKSKPKFLSKPKEEKKEEKIEDMNANDIPDNIHFDNNYEDDYLRHSSGAIEYIPETHEVTLFEHILSRDNFFDIGFIKVYKVIYEYIEKLERDPSKHEEILPTDLLISRKRFLNKVFRKAFSIDYNKKEVFKKIFGDVSVKPATTRLLLDLTNKLEKIDYECEIFAEWIQKILPDTLDEIQRNYESHINRIRFMMRRSDDIDSDKKLVEDLNNSLSKVIKLFDYIMSLVQVFATMHAEVFMHLKSEVDNLSWIFDQPNDEIDYGGGFGDYDGDGLLH